MKDATGREIVIGGRYGYSQQSNGRVQIAIGIVEKINEPKVTIGQIVEKYGYAGTTGEFHTEERRRSVNGCHLFPVQDFILGDKVTTEYYNHGEVFEVVGVLENELLLKGDWSGGTHNVCQTGNYDKSKCKLYKKWLKTKELHSTISLKESRTK